MTCLPRTRHPAKSPRVQQQKTPPFAEWLIRRILTKIARMVYKITTHGLEDLPEGGFLMLPNHLTWVDAILLQIACPRTIRFIVWESYYYTPMFRPFLTFIGAIPISNTRAKEAIRTAIDHIHAGEIVCIFPEGELSKSGSLLRIQRGYEIIARQAKCPVVPVWMDQIWDSIFSFRGGRFFWKRPKCLRFPVTIAYGAAIPAKEADTATVRQRFLELGEYSYQQRPLLHGHIADACLRGLKKNPGTVAVIDGYDGLQFARGRLLAAALSLSRIVRDRVPEKRIGIVLPPGAPAVLANLAALFAGKIPVNLNFTAGRTALVASIRKAEIGTVITAGAMHGRLKEFPWPANVLLLDELKDSIRRGAVKWFLLSKILPAGLLGRLARIPRKGDRSEALLLFTSGSSGEPKGVVLTHRNLLANTRQFGDMLDPAPADVILGALPFFHCFGGTVCLLYPIIEGVLVVTYPNPLDAAKCAALIERHGVTIMLATPTFLRGYLKRATREQFRSVRLLVAGAEKLPEELSEAFLAKFGIEVMQGYGLTETSPAASFNLPNRVPDAIQACNRRGSSGRLVGGLAAQIRDPETNAPLTLHDKGMLWFKGANVFDGYLDDPSRTADVIRDGWFCTGDLARFDEDGFLFIEGRMSRFSKIGGEMVPHETIEAKIVETFGFSSEGERIIAITSAPEEAKGEVLVVLATREITQNELREKLSAAGLPNLWIPRHILRVPQIPVLASGKLDIRSCTELAKQVK
jgi:acyl-[acyl-carrier-protein]-phospholipid O-acyltransferase/long-chain-fatty-acid--[acyl-carrier-protein] ligase